LTLTAFNTDPVEFEKPMTNPAIKAAAIKMETTK